MIFRRIASHAVLPLAIAAAMATGVRSAEPPRSVMIVLDGSGSMWGRIDGDKASKLQAARDALRRALPQLPADSRVGLASFGHRRKGDCSDVETIVAPEAPDIERLMLPVDKLNPKGKGPLVLAIREAAKALGDGRGASIVVVHDGADNCLQDACAAAAEIAKAQPGLKIHTVGMALEAEDARKSTCIAAATGGKSFDARDASQIDAAIGEAVKLATLDPARDAKPERPAAEAPRLVAPPVPASPPMAAPGVDVTATLTAGGAPITAPVRWRISRADDNGPPLLETDAPRLSRALASGSYVIEARLGLAQGRQRIEVGNAPAAPVRVALDAGVITPAARAQKDGGIVEGATYSIRAAKPATGAAAGATLWIGRSGGSDIVLPAGTYVVRAESGLVAREETVTLAAGNRTSLDLILGSGRLELAAALTDDGPALDRVTFIVSEDDPDAPQGRREVVRSAAPNPEFVLPAGTYYVAARAGGAEARQRVAVGAGDSVRRKIALGVSRLSLTTRLDRPQSGPQPGAQKGPQAGGPQPAILTRVLRLDGDRGEAARSAAFDPEFLLPAGRYRILSQAGMQNVRSDRTVEIRPGEDARLDIPIEAGHVVLRLQEGTPAAADQFWEVRDAQGQLVWRTTQSEARIILAPGRYSAQVEVRGRRLSRDFDVERGAQKSVVLGPE